MHRLIFFYAIVIFLSPVFLFSCTKNAAESTNTQQDVLIKHAWKHYQTRTVIIDNVTNAIVTDTITQPDVCFLNSLYTFAKDSIIKRNFQCIASPTEREGRWYLNSDSAFAGSIMIRTSYGTGYILQNFGLPNGKMKLLTETDFELLSSSSGGFIYGNTIAYNTYYLKATN
jgi:hypothetical protein